MIEVEELDWKSLMIGQTMRYTYPSKIHMQISKEKMGSWMRRW